MKILMLDFREQDLEENCWNQIDKVCEKRILLSANDTDVSRHIDADCLLVKLGATVSKEKIDSMPNLKYIGMYGTGYGRIDDKYAASKGIVVCNIPGYSREAVAELVFGMILTQIRELEKARKRALEGDYSDSGYSASEIKGKIFGIIGLGNNGSRTAEIALGFGADVKYWSKNRKSEFELKGIKYENIDSLVSNSDFLSLHLALNKETENFLNEDMIMKIKKGAIVVNTSPMELVDIDALEKRLEIGDITFILDHSDEMKKEKLDRLSKYKNCIIYPPIGYITKEAKINKQEIFLANLRGFLEGTPQNKVN